MEVKANYRIHKISKGCGFFRTIYVPDEKFKRELKSHLPYLLHRNLELDKYKVCHAFVKGRNCATNAMQHIGYQHSVSMDLREFFDSIRPVHVEGKIPNHIINRCFVDGAPRQGLPTSPLISNIALIDCDNKIIAAIMQLCGTFAYTRYADDICISVDDHKAIAKVKYVVSSVLTDNGFELNKRKTHVQSQTNGRRVITGIGVDGIGLYPTRKTIKKLRAAKHQNNTDSIVGLFEWSKCRLPGKTKKHNQKTLSFVDKPKIVSCKYCGTDGLKWAIDDYGRFILVYRLGNQKHACGKLVAPISASDVIYRLVETGFTEFRPKSKTWATGYFCLVYGYTLFVLFRKNGVDIGFHDYQQTVEKDDMGFVSMKDRLVTERHTYGTCDGNVHSIVMNLINSFLSGHSSHVPSFSIGDDDPASSF